MKDLIEILKIKAPLPPFEKHKDTTLEALDKILDIFKKLNPHSSPITSKKDDPKIMHPQSGTFNIQKISTIQCTTKPALNLL